MSQFILPVTVESRKILFLNLSAGQKFSNKDKEVGEDIYVVELPEVFHRTILSMVTNKVIQSLHEKIEDLAINKLNFSFDLNKEESVLLINISDDLPHSVSSKLFSLGTGQQLKAEITDEEVNLILVQSHSSPELEKDYLFIKFELKLQNEINSYSSLIKLFLAKKNQILFTGFDFGSESTQMNEASYKQGSLDPHPVDIFSAMKIHSGFNGQEKKEAFLQYENETLYKSIFFIKNKLDIKNFKQAANTDNLTFSSSDLNTLTLSGKKGPSFYDEWVEIPNLKLIHENLGLTNTYEFTITEDGKRIPANLGHLKTSIYASLLKEIILSYFNSKIDSYPYLRFTLLVPNIYSIDEINETKAIVRSIITSRENDYNKNLKGIEISSISESDAAFLGCLNSFSVTAGNYYIIIDCGKGTTDFSVIQADKENAAILKPVYRNGFAGAGNLITFSIMQSALYYLKRGKGVVDKYYKEFINYLTPGASNNFKESLFRFSEKCKKNYDSKLSQAEVETEWAETKSEDISLEKLFSEKRDPAVIIDFLSQIEHVYDWGGFIQAAVNEIVSKISDNLVPVIAQINKKSRCSGVLFTGRSFLFAPLERATKNRLLAIKGLESIPFIPYKGSLKEICLKGVFTRNILCYGDITSTPIEIDKETLTQVAAPRKPGSNFFSRLAQFFDGIGTFKYQTYSEESNSCEISNTNFNTCQFLVGGKIYQPQLANNISKASLLHSRRGFYVRATDTKGNVHILEVFKVGSQNDKASEHSVVEKSLFPSWYNPQLLKI